MLGYYQHPGEAIRVRLGVRVTVALEYICSASKFTEFDTSYPFKLRIITQLEMPLPNSLLRSLLKSWVKCRYSESNHCSSNAIFIQVTLIIFTWADSDRIRKEFLFSPPNSRFSHERWVNLSPTREVSIPVYVAVLVPRRIIDTT